MATWKVYLNSEEIDNITYQDDCDAEWVRETLINHDGFDSNIIAIKQCEELKMLIDIENNDEQVICNTEYLYLLAINIGVLDVNTLEFYGEL